MTKLDGGTTWWEVLGAALIVAALVWAVWQLIEGSGATYPLN